MTEVASNRVGSARRAGLDFDISEDLSRAAYDGTGTPPPPPPSPLHDGRDGEAQEGRTRFLLGAVGGPKYDALEFLVKARACLLRLRKEMTCLAKLGSCAVL